MIEKAISKLNYIIENAPYKLLKIGETEMSLKSLPDKCVGFPFLVQF